MAVVVQAADGNVLYEFDTPADGWQVGDLLDELNGDGRKGYFISPATGRRQARSMRILPGSDYVFVFVEKGATDSPWFVEHEKVPSPSALANSVEKMKRFLGGEAPIYDIGRTSSCGTPLPLVVESFGLYVKLFKSHVLDDKDWTFVKDMLAMSSFYSNENLRHTDFIHFLEEYLSSTLPGLRLKVLRSNRGQSESDVRVEVLIDGEWILVAFTEVKPEMGLRGEPCIEAMKYFADHVVDMMKMQHWSILNSCCPVLIMEVVGAAIRVGGAAHLDKPCHQPFTAYLHILRFLEDRNHMEAVSRALGSIRLVVASLAEFYFNLKSEIKAKGLTIRDPSINWPYYIKKEQRSQRAQVIQYERQLRRSTMQLMHIGRQKQCVFYLRYPDGQQRIIKFCQRYGVEVHLLWAQEGYAPVFSHSVLDGDWLMINMEFYCEEDGWRPLTALDPALSTMGDDAANKYRLGSDEWEKCKADVRAAYQVVVAHYPLSVHGDLRRQNILYNVRNSKVAFVDFDWAGTHGQDMYPINLNPLNTWPVGVRACAIMRTEHDAEMLDIELHH